MFTWGPITEPGASVMGVVNVTPDSFSDGGRWAATDPAIEHARGLLAAGARVLDVGGESTRPGADPVGVDEEIRRVVPVIEALAGEALVSVDTSKAAVAAAAIDAGARIVNDVSAGRHDPDMLGTVADAGVGFIGMHMQGEPRTMQRDPRYGDVVAEVTAHLASRLDAATVAGIRRDAVMLDPGIGFGKTVAHNLALLAALDHIVDALGVPVLVGASRKSFLGALQGTGDDLDAREDGTTATTVWAVEHGAAMVRVHDVAAAHRAISIIERLDAVAA